MAICVLPFDVSAQSASVSHQTSERFPIVWKGARCIWIVYFAYMNIIKYISGKRKLCGTIVRIARARIRAGKRAMLAGDWASMKEGRGLQKKTEYLREGGLAWFFVVGRKTKVFSLLSVSGQECGRPPGVTRFPS